MNKLTVITLASTLWFVSCSDQSAGNAATNSDSITNVDASAQPIEKRTTPPATPAEEYSGPPSRVGTDVAVKDTPRTSVSIGKDGASIKTKKGTGVSYDKRGIKVERKDVKIDIKRDTL